MRVPWPAVLAGGVVVALGAAGLVRAAVPLPGAAPAAVPAVTAAATSARPTAPTSPITVSGAWVREPAGRTRTAAAYLTVHDHTDAPDRLVGIESGAGQRTVVSGPGGADALTVPAHGSLGLASARRHVMIEQVIGTLRVGETVYLDLTFQRAGDVLVTARVVAPGAPTPTGGPTGSSSAAGSAGSAGSSTKGN